MVDDGEREGEQKLYLHTNICLCELLGGINIVRIAYQTRMLSCVPANHDGRWMKPVSSYFGIAPDLCHQKQINKLYHVVVDVHSVVQK